MHPAILYPRRSQFRPLEVSRVFNCTAPLNGRLLHRALRVVERLVQNHMQAREEIARHAVAVLMRFRARCRMSCSADHDKRQEHSAGPWPPRATRT